MIASPTDEGGAQVLEQLRRVRHRVGSVTGA
jgi:hypothetical protein